MNRVRTVVQTALSTTDAPPRRPVQLFQPGRRCGLKRRPLGIVAVAIKHTSGSHVGGKADMDIEVFICRKIGSQPVTWAAARLAANDQGQSIRRSPEPEPKRRDRARRER